MKSHLIYVILHIYKILDFHFAK